MREREREINELFLDLVFCFDFILPFFLERERDFYYREAMRKAKRGRERERDKTMDAKKKKPSFCFYQFQFFAFERDRNFSKKLNFSEPTSAAASW